MSTPRTDGEGITSGSFGLDPRPLPRRRQAPWSGPECQNPDCGGAKTPVRTSGRDEAGRPLRERVCQSCGDVFVTVETPIVTYPLDAPPVRFAEVDVEHRRRKREGKRRKFGWQPQPHAQRASSVPVMVRAYIDARPDRRNR